MIAATPDACGFPVSCNVRCLNSGQPPHFAPTQYRRNTDVIPKHVFPSFEGINPDSPDIRTDKAIPLGSHGPNG